MIQPLHIEPTEDTPIIIFDKDKGVFEIKGRSLPEDSITFYTPVFSWVDEYVKDPNEETIVNLYLEYFNSASASKIVKLLMLFEQLLGMGKKSMVVWYYHKDDFLMRDRGDEIQSVLDIPFELREM